MKANELRIGNYLNDKNDRLCRVETISINLINSVVGEEFKAPAISSAITSLPHKPIPLTEEWLVKFGFKQITYQTGEKTQCFQLGYWNITNYKNHGFEFWVSDSHDCPFSKKIQHVHQLQNLYFALTGEELTIG